MWAEGGMKMGRKGKKDLEREKRQREQFSSPIYSLPSVVKIDPGK